ncbi:MAG: hypothetical protein ACREUZ_13905 [Burkholderiales bacterium]
MRKDGSHATAHSHALKADATNVTLVVLFQSREVTIGKATIQTGGTQAFDGNARVEGEAHDGEAVPCEPCGENAFEETCRCEGRRRP